MAAEHGETPPENQRNGNNPPKISFEIVPENIYPGLLITTPSRVVESGATRFSLTHVVRLLNDGTITAARIGGQWILDISAVEALIRYEQSSPKRNANQGGRKPGPLSKKEPD